MNTSVFVSHLIALLKRLLLLLILFTVTRVLFLVLSLSYFRPLDGAQTFRSFFFGIRFDFIVVFYINILFILFHLFPAKKTGSKRFQVFLKWLFVVTNSILLLLNFIDIEYFDYTKKRSGWDLLTWLVSTKDTLVLLPHYMVNFWYLLFLWITAVFTLVRFYPKLILKEYRSFANPVVNKIAVPVAGFLLLGAGFIYSRGLEVKPVRIISANNYVQPKYIPLLFNTPFVMLNTINQQVESIRDFYPIEKLPAIYSPVKKYNRSGKMARKNVFIIILESFGKNYTEAKSKEGKAIAPFFRTISEKGLYCSNAYANAGNSIDALPAIVGGFPTYFKTAFVSSAYSINIIRGLGDIFSDEGYETAFFHGGMNGTMGFDKFCQMTGIDHYYGRSEFNDDNYYDGAWGIYDEEFFQFTAKQVNRFEKPFFAVLFSLSSHDPYPIPERYKKDFFPKENKVLRSIAYTDHSLNKFFETARNSEWFDSTLFVICPDHVSMSLEEESYLITNRIPMIYYCSSDTSLTGTYPQVTQQLDIFPSILSYLGYPKSFVSFGNSIFEENYRFSVSKSGVNYQAIDSSLCIHFDGEKIIQISGHRSDSLFLQDNMKSGGPVYDHLGTVTKAYLQNYFFRLNNNLLADTFRLGSLPDNQ
ncbi:MAG: LTA synthase family protein [Bacteroidales bacterium]|jgi:phosphoglycerol transferase MdoB-like AlkP superfamily enzyme